jgi:hypothetical protein
MAKHGGGARFRHAVKWQRILHLSSAAVGRGQLERLDAEVLAHALTQAISCPPRHTRLTCDSRLHASSKHSVRVLSREIPSIRLAVLIHSPK